MQWRQFPHRASVVRDLILIWLPFLLRRTVAIKNSKTILSQILQITFYTSMSLQMDPVLFWEGYLMQHYIETKPHKKCQTSVFHDLLPLFATVPWQAVLDDTSPIYRKNYHKWIRWHSKLFLIKCHGRRKVHDYMTTLLLFCKSSIWFKEIFFFKIIICFFDTLKCAAN